MHLSLSFGMQTMQQLVVKYHIYVLGGIEYPNWVPGLVIFPMLSKPGLLLRHSFVLLVKNFFMILLLTLLQMVDLILVFQLAAHSTYVESFTNDKILDWISEVDTRNCT